MSHNVTYKKKKDYCDTVWREICHNNISDNVTGGVRQNVTQCHIMLHSVTYKKKNYCDTEICHDNISDNAKPGMGHNVTPCHTVSRMKRRRNLLPAHSGHGMIRTDYLDCLQLILLFYPAPGGIPVTV